MARAKQKRAQFQLRLPGAVLEHLEKRYRDTGWEKQLQATAGLVAFECLKDPMKLKMIQWATLIAQGEVSWSQFREILASGKAVTPDQRDLVSALNGLAALAEPRRERRSRA